MPVTPGRTLALEPVAGPGPGRVSRSDPVARASRWEHRPNPVGASCGAICGVSVVLEGRGRGGAWPGLRPRRRAGPGPGRPGAGAKTRHRTEMSHLSSIILALILLKSDAMFPNTISGSEQLEAYTSFSCESERPCHHRADVRKIYMQTSPGNQDYRMDLGPDPFVTMQVRYSLSIS